VSAPRPTEFVFGCKSESEFNGPHVIADTFTNPDCAGVVEMDRAESGLVGGLALGRRQHVGRHSERLVCCSNLDCRAFFDEFWMDSEPMSGIEHLTRLKNHLDYVLISVRFGGLLRVDAENEDVHDWVVILVLVAKFNFFTHVFLTLLEYP
jgi:hypothetical protein